MPCCVHDWSVAENDTPISDETSITDLPVSGTLPAGLAGRYLRIGPNPIHPSAARTATPIGDGMVHAVTLTTGGAASYRNRWVMTDAAAQRLGDAPVERPPTRRSRRRRQQHRHVRVVHLRPRRQGTGVRAHRRPDHRAARRPRRANAVASTSTQSSTPVTGELHLLASASDGAQTYVTVSPGGLTRTIRCIENAPSALHDLRLTRDHVVFLADGFLGITDRTNAGGRTRWVAIDARARHLTATDERDGRVVVHTTGRSLERWTLHPGASTVEHHVVDATPQDFPTTNDRPAATTHRYVWTISTRCAHRHDLVAGTRQTHEFGPHRQPGELRFVADPRRAGREDGGWLIGFVHDSTHDGTDLVVLDAQDLTGPAVATVHIPRRIPNGAHGTWIPADHRKDHR